ncbi:Ctr-domain-containing protein [Abortiporus biennis]|nr:Ctr-domain-containing protein [Abortiporus biennis]
MDHGGHGGHEMPSTPAPRCSMNMLWNTQIENTCIVFRSWHIHTKSAFIFSCLIILLLGVLYEWLREAQKNMDRRIAARLSAQGKGKTRAVEESVSGESVAEETGLLTGIRVSKFQTGTPLPFSDRTIRALLYGSSVFLSFFLMLVFMTYNAYLIVAVVAGAAIGHYIFNPDMDIESVLAGGVASKSMACH